MEEQNKRLVKPEGFDISEVISALQGTSNSLSDVLETLYEIDEQALTKEDHGSIDSEIFLCEGCGWWYEISDQEDEGLCEDCYEKEVDDLDGEDEDE